MSDTIDRLLAHPRVAAARVHLRAGHNRMVEEIVTLTEIPAPPFAEAARAAAYLDMMRDAGLADCTLDGIGNATGLVRGAKREAAVVVAAHLDTVFPAGTDVTVRREGTRLFAPGVGDDTRGFAVNLAIMRAITAAGIVPRRDILFVGDVGEEGAGDLRGIRHLLTEGPHAGRVGAFFTVDGLDSGNLVTEAVGSLRYRVRFTGPGGHSWLDFGTVNPANALGAFAAGLAELSLPQTPPTTCSMTRMGGGTSVNTIPEEVWVDLDLRSVSAEALDRLDAEMRALAETAVAAENARNGNGQVAVHLDKIGNRPAGRTPPDASIVADTVAALGALGFTPRLGASSTDATEVRHFRG